MIEYNIMNHYTRNVVLMVKKMQSLNRDVKVNTDTTDYYQTRDDNRYKGVNDNFFGIMSNKTNSKWKVLFHDDIKIDKKLIGNIEHVLKNAPNVFSITFYNPTNSIYLKAYARGHNVLKNYNHLWAQCSAWNTSMLPNMIDWVKKNTHPTIGAEDVKVQQYCCINKIAKYAIIPSFTKHEGYAESVFKNPAVVGKNIRNTSTYEDNFNAKDVNWKKAFKLCGQDNTKTYYKEGLLCIN